MNDVVVETWMQNPDINLLKLGMAEDREYEALQAYFSFLHSKGASAENLLQREQVLTKFDDYITDINNDGLSYREAVDHYLNQVDKSEWPFTLLVVREYFHFWAKDFIKIAQLNAAQNFEPEPQHLEPISGSLKSIWTKLDENLEDSQQGLISAYEDLLKQNKLNKNASLIKLKLAKLLLIKLAEVDGKNARNYRYAIDATLPIFESKHQRELFLETARELYCLWLAN